MAAGGENGRRFPCWRRDHTEPPSSSHRLQNALFLGHAPMGPAVVNQALSTPGLGPPGFHPHALRAPLAYSRPRHLTESVT